jgi:hypothetical protein
MKKKSQAPQEMTRLNPAAFRFAPEEVRGGGLLSRLETLLGPLLTGDGMCTEFSCTLYAPA